MLQQELLFKIKEVFNAKEKLSIWIIKLAMARNDFLYVHNRLLELLNTEKTHHIGESLYFFRLAVSHYREAIKFIDKYRKDKEIVSFIELLDKASQEKYSVLIESCTPWEESFVKKVVMPIRNNLFHYYDDDFQKNYEMMEDMFSKVISTGSKRVEIDLAFADDISFNISFDNISESDLRETLNRLSQYMSALISFADSAVGTYLLKKKQRMMVIRHHK